MKYNQEEIINALKVIKETCEKYYVEKEACVACPLKSNGLCNIIDNYPSDWDFNDNNSDYRAFQEYNDEDED